MSHSIPNPSEQSNIPYGYCHCGCGQKTRISTVTNSRAGWIKGEPLRFVKNHRPQRPTLDAAFWSYVVSVDTNDCWNWHGTIKSSGYGQFSLAHKLHLAHRVSYELHNGSIPADLLVLHKCDNPSCVNPNHLFLGTHKDNMADKAAKGRGKGTYPSGESHPGAKLTSTDVIEIRSMRSAGFLELEIAEHFGVGRGTVNNILRRQTWRHVE